MTDPTLSGNPPVPEVYVKAVKDFKLLPKETRVAIAAALKQLGYKGISSSGAVTPDLISALGEAKAAKPYWDTIYGNQDLITYLQNRISAEGGSAGGGGSRTVVSRTQINDTDAAALVTAVMQDVVGRGPTEAELAKYRKAIRSAQASNPVSTTYSGSNTSTSGGLNKQQFLIEQLSQSDEARANKVLSFYDTFKQALGVS